MYPNTSWQNGQSRVLGQIATQSFKIDIPSIDSNGQKIGKLIDNLASVDGITINGLSFDIADKTKVFALAREKAFENAKDKAKDYADALTLAVGNVLNIVDGVSQAPTVISKSFSNDMEMAPRMASSQPAAPTTVSVGSIPISYNMGVVFRLCH